MIAAIKEGLAAVAAFFGYAKHRSELKNSKEMQTAEKAKTEVERRNEAETAVGNQDTKKVQELLGE